jgi:DNA excision repair protein ERCC-1
MVDIDNHEENLKELSKTSLINNVTVILCWSAAEAARYLELYKSYEHASAGAIKGAESKGYAEKMVEFVTVPRSINKTDAVSLVSAFGSVKAAVNARPEEIAVVGGWGEKKVRRWCGVVDEPFRVRKAAKRGLVRKETTQGGDDVLEKAIPLGMASNKERNTATGTEQARKPVEPTEGQFQTWDLDDDEEEALAFAAAEEETCLRWENRLEQARRDDELSGGVAAALAKLRDKS